MKRTIAALLFALTCSHSHAAGPSEAACLGLYDLAKAYIKARQDGVSLGFMLENGVDNGVNTQVYKDVLLRAYVAPLRNGEAQHTTQTNFGQDIFAQCEALFEKHAQGRH